MILSALSTSILCLLSQIAICEIETFMSKTISKSNFHTRQSCKGKSRLNGKSVKRFFFQLLIRIRGYNALPYTIYLKAKNFTFWGSQRYIETIVSRYLYNWPYIYFEDFRRLLRNGSLVNSFVVFVAVGVCCVCF